MSSTSFFKTVGGEVTKGQVYPTEVYLCREVTGLAKDSIAMAHQIRSISSRRFGEQCGSVGDNELKDRIRETVKLYLHL